MVSEVISVQNPIHDIPPVIFGVLRRKGVRVDRRRKMLFADLTLCSDDGLMGSVGLPIADVEGAWTFSFASRGSSTESALDCRDLVWSVLVPG